MVPNSLALLVQGPFYLPRKSHVFVFAPLLIKNSAIFSLFCFRASRSGVILFCQNKISDELKMKTFIELIIINADDKLLFLPEPTDFHICSSVLWNSLLRVITHIHSKIHTETSYCHSFLLLSKRVVWYFGIMGLLPSTKSFLILYLHFNNSQQKP